MRRLFNHVRDIRWELGANGNNEYRIAKEADGSCTLTTATSTGVPLIKSGFLHGRCLQILDASPPKLLDWKSTPQSGAGAAYIDGQNPGCLFRGSNPSMLYLPEGHELRASVPDARYLIAMNASPFWTDPYNQTTHNDTEVANQSCPLEPQTTIGLYDGQFRPLLVTPLRRERDLEFGPVPAEEALADPLDKWEEAYFDTGEYGTQRRPQMRIRSKVTWSNMEDVALAEHEGRIWASAQDYSAESMHTGLAFHSFAMTAFIIPLRVEVVVSAGCAPRLLATHRQSQERVIGSCAHDGCDRRDIAPLAVGHKNPSFFVEGNELLFLDWITPTEVGRVTVM